MPYIYCAKLVCEYEWTDKDGKSQGPEIVATNMETHQLEVYDWSNIIAANSPHGNLDEYIKWMAEQNFKKGMVAGISRANISLSDNGTVTVSNSLTSKSVTIYSHSYNAGYNKGLKVGYEMGKKVNNYSDSTGCFERGTLITMADYTNKSIEDIEIGDFVLSYNEYTKSIEPAIVTNTIIWHNTIKMIKIYLDNGTYLHMTAGHPVLTTDGWKSVDQIGALKECCITTEPIEIGQKVMTQNGLSTIVNIEFIRDIPNHDTYNITVPGNNTYFANGSIVHNILVKQ